MANLSDKYSVLRMMASEAFIEALENEKVNDLYEKSGSAYMDYEDGSELGIGLKLVNPDDPYNEDLLVTFQNGKGDHNYYVREGKKSAGKLEYSICADEALRIAYMFLQMALIQYRKQQKLEAQEKLTQWNKDMLNDKA